MSTFAELVTKDNAQQLATETAANNAHTETSNTAVAATGDLVDKTTTNNETAVEATEAASTATETATQVEENAASFNIPSFTKQNNTETETKEAVVTTTTPATNWQDVIKTVDHKELLKAAGISDFAIELNEHIKNGGDAADYIAAKGVDWTKVGDIDLIYEDLKAQYPDATGQQLQRLFNKKYNQGELAEEEEREDGGLLMSADARNLRKSKVEQQSKFKIPNAVQVQQPESNLEKIKLEAEQAQSEQFEKVKTFYESHAATKTLMEGKRVTVKFGDKGSFNFNIDKPEVLTQLLLDGNAWNQVTSTQQGEPDVEKLQRIALYAANPNYDVDIYNYAFAQGRKSLVAEGQHAHKGITQQSMNGIATQGTTVKGGGTVGSHLKG